MGLLTAIKEHGDTMKPFFVYNEKKLTADDILVLYQVSLMAMSEEGSNRRKKEDATVSWWRDMVLDMEGKSLNYNGTEVTCTTLCYLVPMTYLLEEMRY